MPRPRSFELVRHENVNELTQLIKNKEKDVRVLKRLYFIRFLYNGQSVEESAENVGIRKSTGYQWLDRWNKEGYDGLAPKFAGGRPSKLSSEQKKELISTLEQRDDWTTKEITSLIEDKFGIKYSDKQVSRILRSFGMNFGKPFPKDYRRPKDAEEILKKTRSDR